MPRSILVICDYCKGEYPRLVQYINESKKLNKKFTFCSHDCANNFRKTQLSCECVTCKCKISILLSVYNRSKTKRFYCSKSCAAKYNNNHKTYGIRRSKLETYIESQLKQDFSKLDILFNDKTIIEAELDIYCPSLRLAVEINGKVHYEPIYGDKSFEKIQNRDKQKMISCAAKGIELIVINAASHSYVTNNTCDLYYKEIKNIFEKCQLRNYVGDTGF